ncbi:MAG: hypothetical protein ACKPHU_31765, partial [Planctomycetaceae bacterium]
PALTLASSRPRTQRDHCQWRSIKLAAETFKAHGCEVDFIPTTKLGARTLSYHPSSSGPCMNA